MNDQAKYVYKMVESGNVINIELIKQEKEQDVDKIDDTNGKKNPYCERQKEMIQSYH